MRKKKAVKPLKFPVFKKKRVNRYVEANFLSLKNYLILNNINFTEICNFSVKKIKYNDITAIFSHEYTHPSLMHLAARIKKEVKEHIIDLELLKACSWLGYEQRKLYRPKESLTGVQYDLCNAYTTVLYMLGFLTENTYNDLLGLKKQGLNINKILGMALLGNKKITTYTKGIEFCSHYEKNELSNVFQLVAFILNTSFSEINKDFFHVNICKYIDSVLFTDKIEIDELKLSFLSGFINSIKKANKRLLYNDIELHNIFKLSVVTDETEAKTLINFHEIPVKSIRYDINGGSMTFLRKKGEKYETVNYRFSILYGNPKYLTLQENNEKKAI